MVTTAQDICALVVGMTHGMRVDETAELEGHWAVDGLHVAEHALLGAGCWQREEELGIDSVNIDCNSIVERGY